MPFAPSDFSTIQATTNFHLDALSAEPQRLLDSFPHSATKRDALLELRRNLFGLQLRVQFRLVNLLDRNQHFTAGLRRKIALELIDLRAFPANDDSRTRRVNNDLQPIGSTLNVDMRHAGAGEPTFQILLELQVLKQKLTE